MNFTEFSLNQILLQGIEKAGYVSCTPVQEKVLLESLNGTDLYVQSQTGTGKTAAYLVPIIHSLLSGQQGASQALVMVPTRELAVQVQQEAKKLCQCSTLKCVSLYGGVGYDGQIADLKKGADIIIGTPGRVIDLQQSGQFVTDKISYLVIDEADRMFDMGFYPDLRTLIKVLPASEKRQTMLFSATLNSYVKNLAWEYTRNPVEITIEAENVTVDEIEQLMFHVSSSDKIKLLLGLIKKDNPQSLIIFCNTKRMCEVLAKRLNINGIKAEFIIGDLPQSKRLQIMRNFKNGTIKCLVATDVAARGIDVNNLEMVINYDLPNEAENYVHRIGRTARAGKTGKAYTLCSEQDVYTLPSIERYIEKTIPAQSADPADFVEDKSASIYIRTGKENRSYAEKSKGKGRYSSKNEKAKSEYKRDRRVYNKKSDEELLASMSQEERMKFYKEKYSSSYSAKGNSKGASKGTSRNAGASKNNKGSKKNSNNSSRQYQANKKPNSQKTNYSGKNKAAVNKSDNRKAKKSIFSRLASIFKR